jgi:hypothetical protein
MIVVFWLWEQPQAQTPVGGQKVDKIQILYNIFLNAEKFNEETIGDRSSLKRVSG